MASSSSSDSVVILPDEARLAYAAAAERVSRRGSASEATEDGEERTTSRTALPSTSLSAALLLEPVAEVSSEAAAIAVAVSVQAGTTETGASIGEVAADFVLPAAMCRSRNTERDVSGLLDFVSSEASLSMLGVSVDEGGGGAAVCLKCDEVVVDASLTEHSSGSTLLPPASASALPVGHSPPAPLLVGTEEEHKSEPFLSEVLQRSPFYFPLEGSDDDHLQTRGADEAANVYSPDLYRVTVTTGTKVGAGLDEDVHMTLVGTLGSYQHVLRNQKSGGAAVGMARFQRGQVDVFEMEAGRDLGSLTAVQVGQSWGWEGHWVLIGDPQLRQYLSLIHI